MSTLISKYKKASAYARTLKEELIQAHTMDELIQFGECTLAVFKYHRENGGPLAEARAEMRKRKEELGL